MSYLIVLIIGIVIGYKISNIGREEERRIHKNFLMLFNEVLDSKRQGYDQ